MTDQKKTSDGGLGGFFIRLGDKLLALSLKYMPDPTIFAVLFTFLAFALGLFLAHQGPMQMVTNWYKGLWELLAFSMQMCLIIVTGSAIANAPACKKVLRRLAAVPKTGRQAVFMIAFLSILIHFVHWGLGLVVASLFAVECARSLRARNIPFQYGLFGAAAYLGQMTWHGGLSASVGLSIAEPGHIMEDMIGVIPMSEYLFNPMNIVVSIALLFLPPLFAAILHPAPENVTPLEEGALAVLDRPDSEIRTMPANPSVGDRLNYSRVLAYALCALGLVYIVYHFATKGFSLDMNVLNTAFMFIGILLYGNIANYVDAIKNAVGGISGIVFQFPLYAGILGMVKYSGLVNILSDAIVNISTPATFYVLTFLIAALINMFIPSGGGQWAVQGPIAMQSAINMNASVLKTSLCVAYGNTWTNMAQPFWAIALLGVTGLKAKDIMGYCIGIMLMSGLIFLIGTGFLPV